MNEKLRELFNSKPKVFFKQVLKKDKKSGEYILEDHILITDKSKPPKGYIPIKCSKNYFAIMDRVKEYNMLKNDIKELKKSLRASYKYKCYTDSWRNAIKERIARDKTELERIENELFSS